MADPGVASIRVFDQQPFHGTVVVQDAVSPGPGWIVVQDRLNGRPGAIVGYAAVRPGVNRWIRIAISVEPPSMLYATLCADSGSIGTIPGPDAAAVTVGGVPIMSTFRIIERSGFLESP